MNAGHAARRKPARSRKLGALVVGEEAVAHAGVRSSSATACAASPSPRPVKPRKSVVVARTLTRSPRRRRARLRGAGASPPGAARSAAPGRQHAVGVDEHEAGLAHLAVGLGQQLERVGAAVALVVGGEERPDVGEPRGAEQGVGERVGDHVAVGVAREPARVVDRDPAEDERHAGVERVRVDPEADAKVAHASEASACGSDARSSRPSAASGGVRCRRPHGPAAHVDRDEPCGRRRQDVVVDPVADVGDLARRAAGELDDRARRSAGRACGRRGSPTTRSRRRAAPPRAPSARARRSGCRRCRRAGRARGRPRGRRAASGYRSSRSYGSACHQSVGRSMPR